LKKYVLKEYTTPTSNLSLIIDSVSLHPSEPSNAQALDEHETSVLQKLRLGKLSDVDLALKLVS
jgi:hypothetical protein